MGQVATPSADGPEAVVGTPVDARRRGHRALARGVARSGSASRACTTRLPARPGSWSTSRATGSVGPVAAPVAAALGVPVPLINDARAFGLAELRLGAGRGARSMVGLTLGTGVGGVIAVDGRVHLGHDGTAGEVGHQTIDPDGPPCGCGNHGCLEAFARADRIAAACGTATAEAAVVARPGRRPAGPRRSGRRRALPRDRHRQHDHGHLARSGGHRRRHRRGRRPPARADPRGAPAARPDDRARRGRDRDRRAGDVGRGDRGGGARSRGWPPGVRRPTRPRRARTR